LGQRPGDNSIPFTRFRVMRRGEDEDVRSESGPPEPWRRRAFSYVYVLRSLKEPAQIYIGWTKDPRQRLKEHNWGMTRHTAAHRPWELVWYGAFSGEEAVRDFERYLKSERFFTSDYCRRFAPPVGFHAVVER
jgi:predicted GIY-YIG superfamily endonuclease